MTPESMSSEQARLTPCPQCGGERVLAESLNSVQLVRPTTALPGITNPATRLWAVVCLNCGYTTFYSQKARHARARGVEIDAPRRNSFVGKHVRLRGVRYSNGQYHDERLLGMTAEEFDAKYGPAAS